MTYKLDPAFEEARRARNKNTELSEAAKSRASSFSGKKEFEHVEYMGLEGNQEQVFRIIGKPAEVRRTPTDPKLILWSKVVGDDTKKDVHIIWPAVQNNSRFAEIAPMSPDPEWILTRIMDKVLEGKWENPPKGMKDDNGNPLKGTFIPLHKDSKSYDWIMNNKKGNSPYPNQFKPKNRVVMNVIDRHDDWCFENKHSKILTSSKNPWTVTDEKTGVEKTIFFPDYGIPYQLYAQIFDHIESYRGDWSDIDIVVKKKKKEYEAKDSKSSPLKPETEKLGVNGPLTDEEMAYGLYDLDKLFKPSSYNKLLKKFSKMIKQVDFEFDTHFFEELQELALIEIEEMKKNGVTEEQSEDSHEDHHSESAQRRQRSAVKEDTSAEEQLSDFFPEWDILTAKEKTEMVNGIKRISGETSIDGKIIYKTGVNTIPCDECNMELPDSVLNCPSCGADLSSDTVLETSAKA